MVFHETLLPRIRSTLERFSQPVTDFIRTNPIVSSAIVGVTAIGSLTGIAAVVRRRKKKKRAARVPRRTTKRRKAPRKRARTKIRKRRKRHISHASPRHRGHKRVSFTTAQGKRVSFLVKKSTSHRKKRRKT